MVQILTAFFSASNFVVYQKLGWKLEMDLPIAPINPFLVDKKKAGIVFTGFVPFP
jgi:hypothetical protein